MSNLMDYLDWRGDLTFREAPFNEVDNLYWHSLYMWNLQELFRHLGKRERSR